jgi:hypothetical protein
VAFFSAACVSSGHLVVRALAWPGLSAYAAGALLTKYTAAVLVVAPALAVAAPHWLKNWIYYGDPVYPMLARWSSPRPWTLDSEHLLALWREELVVPATLPPEGPGDVLGTLFSFSFVPHDFAGFHGRVPVFGSLFTLTALCLPLLRGTKRLWALLAAAHGGIALWTFFAQDRYLQALLPWMAASTAAICALVWRAGLFPRLGLGALVGLQIVWGADAYFIPSNTILGKSTIRAAADFFAMGHEKRYDERLQPFSDLSAAGRALPRGARVLVHETLMSLGLGAVALLDQAPYSLAASYGRAGSRASRASRCETAATSTMAAPCRW